MPLKFKGFYKIRRYPDGCVAVVFGRRRGACSPTVKIAIERFQRTGLIAAASKGR